jgi:hypothetical protein
MRGTRTILLLFAVVVAAAGWWAVSGGYGRAQQAAAQGTQTTGNPPAAPTASKPDQPGCAPAGTTVRRLPPFPRDRQDTTVHWVTWGTGEFARAFRTCVMKRTECTTNVPAVATPEHHLCAGSDKFTLNPGTSHYAGIDASGVGSTADANPVVRAFDWIGARVADSVQCPPGGCPPPPGERGGAPLPAPSPPKKPKYQEL